MAKRIVLASTFLSSPALVFAVDDSPQLHVAEQRPVLVEPTNGKPVVAEKSANASSPAAAAARTARLPDDSVDDGWVAREHIDQRVPLRDPLAITDPQADSQPPQGQSIAGTAKAPAGLESRGNAKSPTTSGGQSPHTRTLPPQLEGLQPVPLMRATVQPEIRLNAAGNATSNESPDESFELSPAETIERPASPPVRSIPIRRPDLTRGLDDHSSADHSSEEQIVESPLGLSPADQPTESKQPYDDEPDPDNEGEVIDNPLAVDQETDGYIGDLDADADSQQEAWVESDELPPKVNAPARPLVIEPIVQRLRGPMEASLNYYYQRPEKAPERSSWGMLHSIMVYGVETQVIVGRQQYNAVAWMAGNNICRGQRIFTVDADGIAPRSGVGLQGHQGQFLAVFGLIGVPESYPLYVGNRKYSVRDLIAHEQANCRHGEELTFTLIGLSQYLDTDASWFAKDGQRWDFERLIQEELAQPVIGAACGGTHRLMGLSHALRVRREQGRPLTGQWARADQFINDFVDYAWKLQNRDGSMSTEWFESRGDRDDLDRKLQTTGHIVEWLIGVLPDDQLQDPRMIRAISFLTNALYRNRTNDWEIGPKGHALRSLALYHSRVYGDPPPWRAAAVAQRSSRPHHRSR